MPALTLNTFYRGLRDVEQTQYEILAALGDIRRAFSQNEIYPHLADLIGLIRTLTDILSESDNITRRRPDWLEEQVMNQLTPTRATRAHDTPVHIITDMIEWALPHIQRAVDEGKTIYEFVENHLNMTEVGVLPAYMDEGYLIISDLEGRAVHIRRFEVSLFGGSDDSYRTLKTIHVKSISHEAVRPSPGSIKLELLSENRDLPNPATFAIESAIEFPFRSTLLPVAKRKFMRHLSGLQARA
ncbi:MAG: hypothetical protein ACOCSK_01670 [Rhodothermales bacterium]